MKKHHCIVQIFTSFMPQKSDLINNIFDIVLHYFLTFEM